MYRTGVLLCAALLLLASSAVVPAEEEVAPPHSKIGFNGDLPTSNLDTMQDGVGVGTPKQQADMLLRLGISKEIVEVAPPPRLPMRGIRFEAIGKGSAIAFLPYLGESAAVEHLRQDESGTWRVSDQVLLTGWGDDVTYELLKLPGFAKSAILAHAVAAGHGTGTVETTAQLLIEKGGRLVPVLETQEQLSADRFHGNRRSMLQRKSIFLVFPGGDIEETRSTSSDERRSSVERRLWKWSKPDGKFVASAFKLVAGIAEPED